MVEKNLDTIFHSGINFLLPLIVCLEYLQIADISKITMEVLPN